MGARGLALKAALQQREVTVHGEGGRTFQRMQWVRATTLPPTGDQKAAPGSQLEPHVLARLKELGSRLPAAHATDIEIHPNLFATNGDEHSGSVIRWKEKSGKSGQVKGLVGQSRVAEERAAEQKFGRTEDQRPKMAGLKDELQKKADAGSQPHAAALLLAETGLRRGGDDNIPGHYGALTMEARHVTFDGSKAKIEYVGKEGVTNRAEVSNPTLVAALRKATEGKQPNERLWGAEVNEGSVGKTLLPGQKVKDLRTIVATDHAEKVLSTVSPILTGDDKKDARHIRSIIKAVSQQVSTKLNNKPAQALESYIAPQVLRAWGEKNGVKAEWLGPAPKKEK